MKMCTVNSSFIHLVVLGSYFFFEMITFFFPALRLVLVNAVMCCLVGCLISLDAGDSVFKKHGPWSNWDIDYQLVH